MEPTSFPTTLLSLPTEVLALVVEKYLPFPDQLLFSHVCKRTNSFNNDLNSFINKKVYCLFAARIRKDQIEALADCQKHLPKLTALEFSDLELTPPHAMELLEIVEKNPQIHTLKIQISALSKVPSLFKRLAEVVQKCQQLRVAHLPSLMPERCTQILENLQTHTELRELVFEKSMRCASPRDLDEKSLQLLSAIITRSPHLKVLQTDGTLGGTSNSFREFHNALKSSSRLVRLDLSTLSSVNKIPTLFLEAVLQMPALEELNLNHCGFQQEANTLLMQIWSSHSTLQSLSLYGCSGESHESMEKLSLSKNMRHLNVGGRCNLGAIFSNSLIESLSDPECSLQSLEISQNFFSNNEMKVKLFVALAGNDSLQSLSCSWTFRSLKEGAAFRCFMGCNHSLKNFIHKKVLFPAGHDFPGNFFLNNTSLRSLTLSQGDISFDDFDDLIRKHNTLESLTAHIQLLHPIKLLSAKDMLTTILTTLASNKALKQLRLVQKDAPYFEEYLKELKAMILKQGESERVSIVF